MTDQRTPLSERIWAKITNDRFGTWMEVVPWMSDTAKEVAALEAKLAEAEKPWDNHKTFRDVAEQQIEKQTGYYPEDTVKGLQDVIERMEMVASTECWRIQEKLEAAERDRDEWRHQARDTENELSVEITKREQAEQRARDAEAKATKAESVLWEIKQHDNGKYQWATEIARLRQRRFFVAYCHDRHLDPEVRVFLTADEAQKWAWSYMTDHVAHPDLLKEINDKHGYRIEYDLASDHAFVVEVTLNASP